MKIENLEEAKQIIDSISMYNKMISSIDEIMESGMASYSRGRFEFRFSKNYPNTDEPIRCVDGNIDWFYHVFHREEIELIGDKLKGLYESRINELQEKLSTL